MIAELADYLYAFRYWDIEEYSDNDELNRLIWRKSPGFKDTTAKSIQIRFWEP